MGSLIAEVRGQIAEVRALAFGGSFSAGGLTSAIRPLTSDLRLYVAGEAETISRVLELRGDAGGGRAARDLEVVTPGTAAGSAPFAGFGAPWIALGRHCVVIGRVPVAAPLVHVVAHVEEAVYVLFGAAYGLGARLPMTSAAIGVAGQRLRRRIAPRA